MLAEGDKSGRLDEGGKIGKAALSLDVLFEQQRADKHECGGGENGKRAPGQNGYGE